MKKILITFGLFLTLLILFFQSKNDLWSFHAQTDVRTFYNRYTQFTEQHSFKNFDQNEFLPGSLFFFLAPGYLNKNLDYDHYLNSFIVINLFLIALHFILYKKISIATPNYIPVILFITIGPILLFRFELFVSIIFLLAIYLFIKKKYLFSGMAIGLAFMIKIYPVFILPYLLILLFKNGKRQELFKYLVGFFIGVTLFTSTYIFLSGSFQDILTNLTYHAEKPIGIESIVASVESIKSLLSTNLLPHIDMINGIWGIPESGKISIIEYFPYAVLAIFYIVLFFAIKKGSDFNIRIPIFILFIFLFSSKYLNPQYLFWIFGLFPVFNFDKNWEHKFLILNTFLILILTQLTFPIYFTNLLDSFNSGKPNLIFYLLQIRNTLMVLELIMLTRSLVSIKNGGN